MKKILFICSISLMFYACGPKEIDPSMTTQQKYEKVCSGCHDAGRNGAPTSFSATEWKPRVEKGIEKMVENVTNGLGGMPVGGRCANCTKEDFTAMVEYMIAPKQ